jgi:cytochrome c oxidase cbb3-type subunit III
MRAPPAWPDRLIAVLALLAAAAALACARELPDVSDHPVSAATSRSVPTSSLEPGVPHVPLLLIDYREDSVAVWEGMRLYAWYNCGGCHGNGGGAIGPPFADDDWIYGGEPLQILGSIIEGRPDGMPAYGGRLSGPEAMRIVAFVRALAGLTPDGRPEMWPVMGEHMRGATVSPGAAAAQH